MSPDASANQSTTSRSGRDAHGRAAVADSRPQRLPSIRLLITLIVVIPMTVVSAALIAITTLTSNQIQPIFPRGNGRCFTTWP
ncbi:MAG: hypothetical protein H7Z14_10930 [Anaerolineae bacterium]|nr:hypothetical protein [Phycisphaerae bacterium]